MSVIYLSYDGLMEQLGQSQILPYLRQLYHFSGLSRIRKGRVGLRRPNGVPRHRLCARLSAL